MKKTFLSIAILASSIFAFAATNSPAQSSSPAPTEQTAPAKQGKEKKNDKKGARKGSAEGRQNREDRLFEGLNLTDSQKERLTALKEKNRADREAIKKDGKERSQDITPEQRRQMKAEKTRTFLAGVKEILSPEQYVAFLENSFSLKGDGHKMHKAHKDGQKRHGADNKKHGGKQAPSAQKGARADKSRS